MFLNCRWAGISMICILLTVATFLPFWRINHCDFITYDDAIYIIDNGHIQNGLTMDGLRWAFTTGYSANWHPLTWISHMLDVQLFGLNPQWHHLMNLLFHIANTLLLFLVLQRMSKALWQSAFVAALFALHPLHVESVAWVAERKDVLSTLFWMLTMGAYIYYTERPRLARYLPVFIFFALGLMAKPMLVTLPCVLILLDYWPLRRLQGAGSKNTSLVADPLFANKRKGKSGRKNAVQAVAKEGEPGDHKCQWTLIRPLLLEKIPLFILAAISSYFQYVPFIDYGTFPNPSQGVFGYQVFIDMVNSALATAWTALITANMSAPGASGDPPRLLLDPTTDIISLIAQQNAFTPDNAMGTTIYMNQALFRLFNSLPNGFNGYNAPNGKSFSITVKNDYNNFYPIGPTGSNGHTGAYPLANCLVLPWAILGIIGTSVALPMSRWRTGLLLAEAAVVFLALVDRMVRPDFRSSE